MGLIPKPPAKIVTGSVIYDGRDLDDAWSGSSRTCAPRRDDLPGPDDVANPTLTIGTQITETIRRHYDVSQKQANKKAVELLEEVRIPRAAERLGDYPHRFSGGCASA